MSKLYDVINRLEEVAAQGEKKPEIPAEPEVIIPEEKRSPLARILVIAGSAILLGVIVVIAALWWKNSFVQHPAAPVAIQVPPETIPQVGVEAQPESVAEVFEESVDSPTEALPPAPDQQAETESTENFFQAPEVETPRVMSVDVAGLDRAKDEIEQILALESETSPMDVPFESGKNANIQISKLNTITVLEGKASTPLEPSAPPPPPRMESNMAEDYTKTTRWLHQAEIYRHQGEWDSAITLYKRVFALNHDPAVANNLAAALIETSRLNEAYEILSEAAHTAPGDPDIKQNLQVVKQMLEKN